MDPRYAIYFVPAPESELYRFGASVLGTDCYTGETLGYPSEADADWAEAVRAPQVYGFHATMKAPFRLAHGTSERELIAALDDFAERHARVDAGFLTIAELGHFIALIPARPSVQIGALAGACVREFDRFRAPMRSEERSRRLRSDLRAQQTQYVDAWGYPYVFEEFRFHMTLTGSLPHARRAAALSWLKPAFATRRSARQLLLDRLVVSRQDSGAFQVIHAAELA